WAVCTTWLNCKRTYYLIDVWRGRLEFPQLKRKLIDLARQHRPNRILIEKAGPGLHLIQELKAEHTPRVPLPIGITTEGDKLTRMEAECARFDAGRIHLQKRPSWLEEFVHEIFAFPHARHDDQIDSVSQFLAWAEARGRNDFTVGLGPKIFVDGRLW